MSNRTELELSELQISFFLIRHTFLLRREKDFSNITEQMSNISVDQTCAKVDLQGLCDKGKIVLQGIIKTSVTAMEYFNDGWLKNCPEETKARGESAEGLCLGENVNMWSVCVHAQSLQCCDSLRPYEV